MRKIKLIICQYLIEFQSRHISSCDIFSLAVTLSDVVIITND